MTDPVERDAADLKPLISLVAQSIAAQAPAGSGGGRVDASFVEHADTLLRALARGETVSFDTNGAAGRSGVVTGSASSAPPLSPTMSSTMFSALYAYCLGRLASADEIAYWTQELANGRGIADCISSIIESDEARAFSAGHHGAKGVLSWKPIEPARRPAIGSVAQLLRGRPIAELAFIPSDAREASTARRRIAIDALQIAPGVSGGVEVYMKTLVRSINLMQDHEVILVCRSDQVESYMALFGSAVGYCFRDERYGDRDRRWIDSLARNAGDRSEDRDAAVTFSTLARRTGAHILHSPVQIFSHFDSGLPSVLNLHDLQHIHLPENFSASDLVARDQLYGRSAQLADVIMVSSQFVADDIVSHMQIPRDKLSVIPATWNPDLNVDIDASAVERVSTKYKLPRNFVFFPGQFWKHKNQARLVAAVAQVRSRLTHLDLHLVLTGYRGHTGWPDVERAIADTGMSEKVVCLDYIPIEDLPGIYKSALACVVPSLFEASSYPVIEAQRIGCPSACSTVTSLPELMEGGAGLLFDPRKTDEIASAIETLCSDADLRSRIANVAREKVERDHSMAAYVKGLRFLYDKLAPMSAIAEEHR